MTPDPGFNFVLLTWLALALVAFPVLLRIRAPYGRYAGLSWGPGLSSQLGWFVMELPALLVFAYFFLSGGAEKSFAAWVFFALWIGHYANRSLIYPFRRSTGGKSMPLAVVAMAIFFNTGNGYLNGHYLGALAPVYESSWLSDPRFVAGIVLFATGAIVNLRSDTTLLALRNGAEKEYQIPHGGLFKWVSCPNYLGEMIEWTGFALATWSPAALVFAIWTAANLIPRALSHHAWYRSTFQNYPPDRTALVPKLF